MLVSPPTRTLVARLPTGETRLGAPRLRSAYALQRLSRAERDRIADELRRAGLVVALDPYGLVVRKGRDLDPHAVRLRPAELPRLVRGTSPASATTAPAPTQAPRARGARRRSSVAVLAATAATAAVVAGVARPGHDAVPPRTAASSASALERTHAARRLGVLALRRVRAGDPVEARELLARSRGLAPAPVVEAQRAARALARLQSGRPPGGTAG